MTYSITDIINEAFERYNIKTPTRRDACRKQIEKVIKQRGIKPIEIKKKTEKQGKPANAYSEEVKNEILNNWLFDYFCEFSDKYAKLADLENGYYEDQKLELLNEQSTEKQFETSLPIEITEYSKKYINLRNNFMIEAIFSKFYTFNSDKLLKDLNQLENIEFYKLGEINKGDAFVKDNLKHWENYVDEKK